MHEIMDLAESVGANDWLERWGGSPHPEGVVSLAGYGGIFRRNVKLQVLSRRSV